MVIRFRCPECDKHLKTPDGTSGRAARCTRCGATVIVPEVVSVLPADEEGGEDDAGPLRRTSGSQLPLDLVDMTAMVDIVFFLLIFFLVTSMQGVCASIGMPTPDPQKVSTKGAKTIADFEKDSDYLIVRIDQDNSVWIQDQEIPSDQELRVKLRELFDGPQAPRRMLVLGNGDAYHATVVRVLDAGNSVGIDDVRLALDEEAY